jgi:NAD(P)-dependent dehydrogenase (short-subunit alcohol dehydrogenase family)
MELGLKGRTAVITGGSKGIGLGIGRALAAEGVKVVLLARGKDELERAAEGIRKEFKVPTLAIPTDITATESVRGAAKQVGEHRDFGRVNILVNNAGSAIRRIERQILWDDADWLGDAQVKILGTLRVVREFLKLLATDGTGRIINITGVAGMTAWSPALTHGFNNAAINHATGYLAQDMAKDNITVNAVVPGLISTEWRQTWADNMGKQQGKTRDEFLAEYCKRQGILAGRWGSVQEVADAVVFLASDRARYINGAKLTVDGGITLNPR